MSCWPPAAFSLDSMRHSLADSLTGVQELQNWTAAFRFIDRNPPTSPCPTTSSPPPPCPPCDALLFPNSGAARDDWPENRKQKTEFRSLSHFGLEGAQATAPRDWIGS
jgi:hypothetical protein